MSERILRERRGAVALLGLDRPERANAYDTPLLLALRQALRELAADRSVKALVVHAGACPHFCAGADRGELDRRPPEEALDLLSRQVFSELAAFPRPTVAALRGAALGGGLELALACDLRVMATDGRVGFPETRLGLIPAAGGCQRAAWILGPARARELILFGLELDAARSLEIGLASELAPPEEVLDLAAAWAERAARRHPLATRLAKQALNQACCPDLGAGFEGAAQAALYALRGPELP